MSRATGSTRLLRSPFRRPVRHALLGRVSLSVEPLEDRRMLSGDTLIPGAIYEGTPYVLPEGAGGFQLEDRWTNTATDGGGLGQGDATTLTWSIVPDGTFIDETSDPNQGDGASSDLIAFLDGIRGAGPGGSDLTQRPWFSVFADSFARLSAVSGLNYVYEPNDDGEDLTSALGELGLRGDVRVGGRLIDGEPAGGSILAFNFFPNNGDMVIDTGNTNFYSQTDNNSLSFRNVVMHEAGHGFGLEHVLPTDQTKLMEPTLTTAFDGPQFDDILGMHRHYGDINERGSGNDSTATATNLGILAAGSMLSIGGDAVDASVAPTDTDFISIDDNGDVDVYRIQLAAGGGLKVLVTPIGPSYDEGPQGDDPTSLFDAASQNDLAIEILNSSGSVVAAQNANGLGGEELISAFDAAAGGSYFVRITGSENAAQFYQLDLIASDRYEPNNSLETATVLGSLPAITLNDLSIFSGDEDYFRYTAHETGKLIVNAFFVDDIGDLDMRIYAEDGGLIASSTSISDNESIVIPVVGQETYIIAMNGFMEAMNTYDLEIENFAAPTPTAVHLNPADDTGMMNNDNVTSETQPQFLIQVDLSDFENMGIPIDQAADTPGADVVVTLVGTNTATVVTGNASRVAGPLWSFTPAAPLASDVYFVSAAVEITDGQFPAVVGNGPLSPPLWVTIDSDVAGPPAAPDLLSSSDSGMLDDDEVTNKMQPAFAGVVAPNDKVRVFAQKVGEDAVELIGQGVANSDGTWEVTVEPLVDGVYDITVRTEDAAGLLSDPSEPLRIWIDTAVPNTPHIDLITDTGRHDADNVTNDDTPTLILTGDDTVDGGENLFPHDVKYRLYDRPGAGTGEVLIYDSFADLADFTSAGRLTIDAPTLAEGVHALKLEVEDRAGNISPDFLLEITIDVQAPPVQFGHATGNGLAADSDSGVASDRATGTDLITNDTTPTLYGLAEADALVRVFADLNSNGAIDAGEPLLGETVAVPFDGNQAEPDGYWELTSAIDLNAIDLFPVRDGEALVARLGGRPRWQHQYAE